MKKRLFLKLWGRIHFVQNNRNRTKEGIPHRIHSVENFRFLLERERVRTERSGLHFSLVVFEMRRQRDSLMGIEGLTHALTRRVRLTDEVGWFSEQELGVLLVNTSTEGAWRFTDHILQEIPNVASIRSFNVYTYPTQWQADQKEDFKKSQCSDHSHQMDRLKPHGICQEPFLPSHH